MPSKPLFGVEAIRKLVRERVEASSLRAVSAEIPMSKSGLDSFLQGRNPYSATRPKLAAWYIRNRGQGRPVTEDELEAAMAILAAYVSQDERPEVRQARLSIVSARLEAVGQILRK